MAIFSELKIADFPGLCVASPSYLEGQLVFCKFVMCYYQRGLSVCVSSAMAV